MKLLPGFVIFGGICGTAAAYVSHRLSTPFVDPGSLWWVASLFGALVALAVSAAFILQPSPAHPHRERIQVAGFLVFGFLSVSLVFVLTTDLLLFIMSWWLPELDAETKHHVWLAASGLATLSTGWAILNSRRPARVHRLEISVPNLPEAFDGYRVIQISDIHIGPGIGRQRVERIVDQCNAECADLVALTGDLADGSAAALRDASAPLAELQATDGVFFVTGNHDYYSRVDPWCARTRELGMTVLVNEFSDLVRGDDRIRISGVTDPSGGYFKEGHAPELMRARGESPPACSLLLAHQPKCARQAARLGFSLQLSGHTHGGQYFPFNVLIYATMRHVAGLYRVQDMPLFVHRGTTWWGPPMRLGSPHEIAVLTLRVP